MQLATLRSKHRALAPVFTERSRRVWAATEAQAIGHGGIALVEQATGISRSTTQRGIHPDRDAQFRHIAREIRRFQQQRQPAISVDTKKKELVGDFKNAGWTWRPAGTPARVRVHDFVIPANGKAIPNGVYDLQRNEGWVSLGIDHDTASFAVNAIRRWWQRMGRPAHPKARSLVITADAGGSNGTRLSTSR
jgi:DDE family transposase